MKPVTKKTTKNVPTKGVRLNWQSLSSVKPVIVTQSMTRGSIVTTKPASNTAHRLLP